MVFSSSACADSCLRSGTRSQSQKSAACMVSLVSPPQFCIAVSQIKLRLAASVPGPYGIWLRHALVKTWCCSLVSATAIVQAEVIFTDALQAVSIGACHCSVDQFIHYLRVSSWIERVHQVLRRDSARRFRYSVPIAVVDNIIVTAPRVSIRFSKS